MYLVIMDAKVGTIFITNKKMKVLLTIETGL